MKAVSDLRLAPDLTKLCLSFPDGKLHLGIKPS